MTTASTTAAASTSAATTAASTSAAATAKTSLGKDFNTFLNMLTTQLKHQDPLSPMDSTQFTSQLVQYSGVEQQINANTNLEKLITLQQANSTSQAISYLNQNVEISSDKIPLQGGSADYIPGRDYNDLRAPESILGSPMSLVIWEPASKGWPIFPIPDELRHVLPSDVETLLINGSVDFSTPLEFGRDELLPSLKNGKLVTLAEMGHVNDFWSINPSAADRLLTSFYATGRADDSGFSYLPMDFKVGLGFPTLAKILFGTGVLLLAFIFFALMHGLRRLKVNKV